MDDTLKEDPDLMQFDSDSNDDDEISQSSNDETSESSSTFHNTVDVDDLISAQEEEQESQISTDDSANSLPTTINTNPRRWPFNLFGITNKRQEEDTPSLLASSNGGESVSSESTAPSNKTVKKPRKSKSKPRHQNRRWRFRQGMWNAGHSLRVLEEGEEGEEDESQEDSREETQGTSAVTPSLNSALHFGPKQCWTSRWCQVGLVLILGLLVGFLVLAVVFFFGEGSIFEDEEEYIVPIEDNTTQDDMDWTFDPSLLEGQPRPVRSILPNFTLQAILQDPNSPQSLAVQFVENHPQGILGVPNWKKLQLVALASFYYTFNGNDWPADKQTNWLNYQVDECEWGDKGVEGEYFGVACTQDQPHGQRRFTDLNLDWFLGFGLVGFPDAAKGNEMPPEIVFLQDLTSLGLMNCGLSARLSSLLPPTLPQLSHLKRISFRFNNIEGTIPSSLGLVSQLEYLSLGSNFLSGTLPPEMGGLTRLEELFLYSNRLEGSIPYNWRQLSSLTEFSAISNELSGTIPTFVSEWQDLEFFFIDHNPLQGTVPSEICMLPNLTSVLVPCTVDCGRDCGDLCECY